MLTLDRFTTEWQSLHHFPMDLSGDTPFYYEVYTRLQDIAEKRARWMHGSCIFSLLMYVENTVAIGLDACYERLYRSIQDLTWHWCHLIDMDDEGITQVRGVVAQAIATAPNSSLLRWMEAGILSRDFFRLKDVAIFCAQYDLTLCLLYHNLSFREDAYMRILKGDERKAWEMIWSDMAFNWQDKTGQTILQRLAEQFDIRYNHAEIVNLLESVRPERLEIYLPQTSAPEGTLTLTSKYGGTFGQVICHDPLPEDYRNRCFVGQLVTYLGKTYINGPGAWYDRTFYDRWDSSIVWHEIEGNEREEAMFSSFTTPSGEEFRFYDDLYADNDEEYDYFVDDEDFDSDNIGSEDFNEIETYVRQYPSQADKRKRNKQEKRKVPDYRYQPRGRKPSQYFQKKVEEVRRWTVDDANDLNYGLRVYEGWCRQAQTYLDEGNYDYALFIAHAVVWEASYYATLYASFSRQLPRMKKIIRRGHKIIMASLPHDPANWRECQLCDYREILSDEGNILNREKWIDLEKAVREIERLTVQRTL